MNNNVLPSSVIKFVVFKKSTLHVSSAIADILKGTLSSSFCHTLNIEFYNALFRFVSSLK
jgi:hypothetical protein